MATLLATVATSAGSPPSWRLSCRTDMNATMPVKAAAAKDSSSNIERVRS